MVGYRPSEATRAKMRDAWVLRRARSNYRSEATTLREGDMVVCRQTRHDPGVVGLLIRLGISTQCVVTFGSGGPVRTFKWTMLRRATVAEIKEAGLWGVGCNQGQEP